MRAVSTLLYNFSIQTFCYVCLYLLQLLELKLWRTKLLELSNLNPNCMYWNDHELASEAAAGGILVSNNVKISAQCAIKQQFTHRCFAAHILELVVTTQN
jgi:hypothetical protein